MKPIVIIGAGLAGLAAGVKLSSQGRRVIIYEAAPFAGGRCRSYHDKLLGRTIDNGNHLILGANTHALDLIGLLNCADRFHHAASPNYSFIDVASGEGYTINTASLAYYLRAKDFAGFAKLAFADSSITVQECFANTPFYTRFIEPFCLAVLNTSPERAAAIYLRRVIWQMIKAGQKALDYYLPKTSWQDALIDPALEFIQSRGGEIHYQTRKSPHDFPDQRVILAVPPSVAADFLPEIDLPHDHNAIINGHFVLAPEHWRFVQPFIGVQHGLAQWIFYRQGIISTTTSAANAHSHQSHDVLAQMLWEDICAALRLDLPLPAHRILVEHQATMAATAAHLQPRPTSFTNIVLAGDYTTSLPATIESAILSGLRAADAVLIESL